MKKALFEIVKKIPYGSQTFEDLYLKSYIEKIVDYLVENNVVVDMRKERCGVRAQEAIRCIDDVLNSDYHYNESLGYQLTSDDFEWLEKSKEALEKQIPKKPILAEEQHIRYSMNYICPLCGKHFSGTGIASYCYHCGQALIWEDHPTEIGGEK